MKRKIMSIGIVAIAGLSGCNHVSRIGEIHGTEYHAVRTTDISGPNGLLIISRNTETGEQTVQGSFGTAGILPSAVAAGGDVAAARARRPDETSIGDRQYITPQRP